MRVLCGAQRLSLIPKSVKKLGSCHGVVDTKGLRVSSTGEKHNLMPNMQTTCAVY